MPVNCINCNEKYYKGTSIKFFRFPKEKGQLRSLIRRRRDSWLTQLQLDEDINLECKRICCKHFISGKPADIKDVTNIDWIPSINICNRSNATEELNREMGETLVENEEMPNITDVNVTEEFVYNNCYQPLVLRSVGTQTDIINSQPERQTNSIGSQTDIQISPRTRLLEIRNYVRRTDTPAHVVN